MNCLGTWRRTLESGAVVGVTVQDADEGDTTTNGPVDETRRIEAIHFAPAINTREAQAKRELGAYQSIANLAGVPEGAR